VSFAVPFKRLPKEFGFWLALAKGFVMIFDFFFELSLKFGLKVLPLACCSGFGCIRFEMIGYLSFSKFENV
jgi:hypothetical protein